MEAVDCTFVYDLRQCHSDPEEDNYETYVMYNTTRSAMHVGNRGGILFYSFNARTFEQSRRWHLHVSLKEAAAL